MGDTALAEAYAHCRKVARGHYENFPLASVFLPARLRDDVAALYAYLRAADDVADEEGRGSPRARAAALRAWRLSLAGAQGGGQAPPAVLACAETLRRRSLDVRLVYDLLRAFRSDLRNPRYPSLASLLSRYCRYSANPVGRLVLQLFGDRDPRHAALSDSICSGLQLANFWQDVGTDARRGRVYLPRDRMRAHGVAGPELTAPAASPGLRALLAELARATRALFEAGRPLCDLAPRGLRTQVRLTYLGGLRVLARLERMRFDPLSARVRLTARDAPALLLRATALWRRAAA